MILWFLCNWQDMFDFAQNQSVFILSKKFLIEKQNYLAGIKKLFYPHLYDFKSFFQCREGLNWTCKLLKWSLYSKYCLSKQTIITNSRIWMKCSGQNKQSLFGWVWVWVLYVNMLQYHFYVVLISLILLYSQPEIKLFPIELFCYCHFSSFIFIQFICSCKNVNYWMTFKLY